MRQAFLSIIIDDFYILFLSVFDAPQIRGEQRSICRLHFPAHLSEVDSLIVKDDALRARLC
jgi:hypothetical protein